MSSPLPESLFPRPGKSPQGALDSTLRNTVGDPKIPRRAKTTSRHNENVLLLEKTDKGHIVGDRAPGKEIEGAPRLNHIVACLGEPPAKEISSNLVQTHVDAGALEALHDPLHQGRRIDEAENAIRQHHPAHEGLHLVRLGMHRGVTESLPGKGEILGVRGGDDAVPVSRENARYGETVIDDLAVGLVRDEIEGLSEPTAPVAQELAQSSEG